MTTQEVIVKQVAVDCPCGQGVAVSTNGLCEYCDSRITNEEKN